MTQLNEQIQDEMAAGREPAALSPAPEAPVTPARVAAQTAPAGQAGNSFAVAGMVLGISSIVFCWWGLLTLAMVIMAITFGCIGIQRANQGAEKKGMAIAGLACGAFGGLLYLVLGVVSLGIGFFL